MSTALSWAEPTEQHMELLSAHTIDEQHADLLPERTMMSIEGDLLGDIQGGTALLGGLSDRALKRDITPVKWNR